MFLKKRLSNQMRAAFGFLEVMTCESSGRKNLGSGRVPMKGHVGSDILYECMRDAKLHCGGEK
jgi:hypothetical protein